VTSIKTVSATAYTNHLPRPVAISDQIHSDDALPKSSLPNVADSGRISFGAACRLPAVR
jgi:hypothetical protein